MFFTEEIDKKLFDYLYCSVASEGGDGDLVLVLLGRNHKEFAIRFELYLLEHDNWQMKDCENGDIVFWNNQESFIISNNDHFCRYSDRIDGKYPDGKSPCTQKVIIQ